MRKERKGEEKRERRYEVAKGKGFEGYGGLGGGLGCFGLNKKRRG